MKKVKNTISKVTRKVYDMKWKLMALVTPLLLTAGTAYATTADDKWNAVIGFLLPWISRLGGVVILIGAIEFGLAFKNDDAEGKTKGLRTVIAGCIVLAVGLGSDIFLFNTTPTAPPTPTPTP